MNIINGIINFIATRLPVIIFLVIAASFIVGVSAIVYHLIRFGIGLITKVLALFLVIFAVIALATSFYFFLQIDFTALANFLRNILFIP